MPHSLDIHLIPSVGLCVDRAWFLNNAVNTRCSPHTTHTQEMRVLTVPTSLSYLNKFELLIRVPVPHCCLYVSSLSDSESGGGWGRPQRFHRIPVARETIFLPSGHALSSSDQLQAQCSPCCDFGKANKQKGEMLTEKSRLDY